MNSLNLVELPEKIMSLLTEVGSPLRLIRHLTIVYSTALEITDKLLLKWPNLDLNRYEILFGAATHDIGKSKMNDELYEPGNLHELEGYRILLEKGYEERLARFAKRYGTKQLKTLDLDELIVILSDKVWKSKRLYDLEEMASKKIAEKMGLDFWEVNLVLDSILNSIAEYADKRLAWQLDTP